MRKRKTPRGVVVRVPAGTMRKPLVRAVVGGTGRRSQGGNPPVPYRAANPWDGACGIKRHFEAVG
jgi:hypothetical protein